MPESLDDVTEEGDCNKRPIKELLTNEHIKNPEQIYIEKETHQEIHTALNNLSAREREYLYYRFGFIDEYHDRTESAYHFHLSNSRAKRLEEDALRNFSLELPW